jgi:hypothetical protein
VKVRGCIDIVDVDGNIIEVKTAAKRPSGIDPGHACHLATYRQLLPKGSAKARLDTLAARETPQLVKIECQVTVAGKFLACNLYPRVRAGISDGIYFPNRNSNLYSRKYCKSRGRMLQGVRGR